MPVYEKNVFARFLLAISSEAISLIDGIFYTIDEILLNLKYLPANLNFLTYISVKIIEILKWKEIK